MRGWRSLLGNWLYIALVVFISAQIAMFAAQPAQAAPEKRILKNPPRLELRQQTTLPSDSFYKTEAGRDKEFDLKIEYIDSKIRNPGTGNDDNVRLRGYVGTGTSEDAPYVAPTIEVKPGDTVRVNLENKLPPDDDCTNPPENVNKPHCFNGTNLHTHGLWISPTGNSDNVLLSINPGEKFQYEFNIPSDHPAGTFWYHTHRHGSTALQVASGMAGALIVRGDRKPEQLPIQIDPPQYAHGDIDTLVAGLKKVQGEMPERILVLQQIQYACGKKDDGSINWNCSGKTGEIESYDLFGVSNGSSLWEQSGRYTSINGEVIPTIQENTDAGIPAVKAGQIERWRIIHGGVRDTINLEFRKLNEGVADFHSRKADETESYIQENCQGHALDYFVIADDGLTRSQAWKTKLTTLQPGYRSDALVVFPEGGKYCVIDTFAPGSATVTGDEEKARLLAVVEVDEADVTGSVDETYVRNKLVAAARKSFAQDLDLKEQIVNDLKDGLKLSLFTPHPDITDDEVANAKGQKLAFFIDISTSTFGVSNTIGDGFRSDFKPFDPKRVDRKLKLGDAEEWTLQSYFVGHPFHIHVNPFQIVKILDPNGKDVSADTAEDCVIKDEKKICDPQYPGLKGVWKDTLWVKGTPFGSQPPTGVYTIVVRTRYQRYIGDFVLHCHILDHEDQGMMQRISIVLPEELYKSK